MSSPVVMRLAMVAAGETVCLISVEGGMGIKKRLADLGLNQGEKFSVVQSDGAGPLILAVRDSRLVLGKGVAHKIIVSPA